MKRRAIIILALLATTAALVAFLVAAWAASRSGLSANAQAEMDAYLGDQQAQFSQTISIVQYERAEWPWYFTPTMSDASYSDGIYYGTTHSYGGRYGGSRPLPYPPIDLWCILLEQGDRGAQRVIYVALHEDLYTADWVVHEPEQDRQALSADLARVGCLSKTRQRLDGLRASADETGFGP